MYLEAITIRVNAENNTSIAYRTKDIIYTLWQKEIIQAHYTKQNILKEIISVAVMSVNESQLTLPWTSLLIPYCAKTWHAVTSQGICHPCSCGTTALANTWQHHHGSKAPHGQPCVASPCNTVNKYDSKWVKSNCNCWGGLNMRMKSAQEA